MTSGNGYRWSVAAASFCPDVTDSAMKGLTMPQSEAWKADLDRWLTTEPDYPSEDEQAGDGEEMELEPVERYQLADWLTLRQINGRWQLVADLDRSGGLWELVPIWLSDAEAEELRLLHGAVCDKARAIVARHETTDSATEKLPF